MPLVTVPKVLREKLSEEGADALVVLINEANGQTRTDVLTFVEEKFARRLSEAVGRLEIKISGVEERLERRLSEEMGKVSVEFAKVRQELATEVGKLNAAISEAKADLIRWMFIFWVGQIGAIFGILFAFFRK